MLLIHSSITVLKINYYDLKQVRLGQKFYKPSTSCRQTSAFSKQVLKFFFLTTSPRQYSRTVRDFVTPGLLIEYVSLLFLLCFTGEGSILYIFLPWLWREQVYNLIHWNFSFEAYFRSFEISKTSKVPLICGHEKYVIFPPHDLCRPTGRTLLGGLRREGRDTIR